jgi:daunorubicin resistance ABC transporter ATP-binding subunit
MHDVVVQHTNSVAVHTHGLGKRFGDLWAVQGLDLEVPAGQVLGVLGHNGAGKTTLIRMLTTLLPPDAGRAVVAGFDVAGDAAQVRRHIAVAAQQATVDGLLSAHLNLQILGQLVGLSRHQARQRADELLEAFGLRDAAGKLVKTLSGGMRRRLDLAATLVADPTVLFLDEPTTGLDPRSREQLWQMLRDLVAEGMTVVLTTQYLEEADRLADEVVVLDHGRAVASGTPAELKARIGGDRVDVTLPHPRDLPAAIDVLRRFASGEPTVDSLTHAVTVPVPLGVRIPELVRALDDADLDVLDVNRREATLDDVFLRLT